MQALKTRHDRSVDVIRSREVAMPCHSHLVAPKIVLKRQALTVERLVKPTYVTEQEDPVSRESTA